MREFYDNYWRQPAPPPANDPLAHSRQALLWSSIGRRSRPVTALLECGCGDGRLVAAAAQRGIEAVGMDISAVGLEGPRKTYSDCRFVEHSIEDRPWPVPTHRFDVVVAFEVIEHLLRPRELLLGAREALATDGHLALTTPYHGLAKNTVLAVTSFDRHYAVEGEHIRFFTDRALNGLLAECGFAIEEIRHFGRIWALWAGVYIWARRLG